MDIDELVAQELTRLDRETMPSAEVVLAQLAVRRRRRSTLQVTSVATAALVLTAGVGFAINRTRSVDQPTNTATPLPTSKTPLQPDYVYAHNLPGVFLDSDHAFLTMSVCAPRPDCRQYVVLTGDGGHTWQSRRLPKDDETLQVVAFDQRTLVAQNRDGNNAAVGDGAPVFLSRDAGVTWQDITKDVGAPIDRVPPGSRLAVLGLTAVGIWTADNKFRFLALPEWPTMILQQVAIGSDGTIIVFGAREGYPGDDPLRTTWMRITHDGGANWTTVLTSVQSTIATYNARIYTVDGRTVYFYAPWGELGGPTGGPDTMICYVSHDSGLTWSKVDLSEVKKGGSGEPGWPVTVGLAADGGFVLVAKLKTLRVEPGTAVAHAVSEGPNGLVANLTGGGLLREDRVQTPFGDVTYATSRDGVTWIPLTVNYF